MGNVVAGRRTVAPGQDVTVFLIGMHVAKPWRVDRWAPVMAAMPRMLRYLQATPEAGLLGFHNYLGRTTLILSYWRSPEHLRRFAADPDAPHLAPWREFMSRAARDSSVGVWHETYTATPGSHEVIYHSMPPFGLGKALGTVPVGAGTQTAAGRLAV